MKSAKIVQSWYIADISAVIFRNLHEFSTEFRWDDLIGIQSYDPVSSRLLLGKISSRLNKARLFMKEDLGSERPCNFDCAVITVHINDDDFVNPRHDRSQCTRYVPLFVQSVNDRAYSLPHAGPLNSLTTTRTFCGYPNHSTAP